jgi:hypothetical protein
MVRRGGESRGRAGSARLGVEAQIKFRRGRNGSVWTGKATRDEDWRVGEGMIWIGQASRAKARLGWAGMACRRGDGTGTPRHGQAWLVGAWRTGLGRSGRGLERRGRADMER